ncbi:MAG: GNAT family N-acetyltransferase [Crocinitomicaceae bacterium]|nr:GNAT family N-acetyltransferase [Crocinitomicaceae bacterium]
MKLDYKFIAPENILSIMPLLIQVNKKTPIEVLEKRLKEMVSQNYKCLGIYDGEKLIGICGLWFMTRHYCGRSMEPDHVMIDPAYQNKGIGKQLFEWLFKYADENGIEATELNTYVNNHGSHKFYFNLGYIIKGYHFVRFKE